MWFFKKSAEPVRFEKTPEGARLVSYSGEDKTYIVPDEYEGAPVTEIAPGAFKSKALQSVYLGANIKTIGKKAFAGCAQNFSLVLRAKAERAEGALLGCRYVYFEENASLTLVSYAAQDTEVVLADECCGYPVTAVGEKVFYMFAYLKSIRLPQRLRAIGAECFLGCSDLEAVELPPSLQRIGAGAFAKSGLREIVVPESVREVGRCAFLNCNELEKAIFQGADTVIEPAAFAKSGLTEVALPENLSEIQSEVFRGCKKLSRIAFPRALEAVWEFAFAESGVCDITLPDSAEVIGEGAFSGMTALKSAFLSAKIREIGAGAFSHCPALSGIRIFNNAFSVREYCLIDTARQRLIACLEPLSPENAVLPTGLREIGDYAFSENQRIKTLILPESVERIGSCAFQNMKALEKIEIKSIVAEFGDNPFIGTQLNEYICPDEIESIMAEFME